MVVSWATYRAGVRPLLRARVSFSSCASICESVSQLPLKHHCFRRHNAQNYALAYGEGKRTQLSCGFERVLASWPIPEMPRFSSDFQPTPSVRIPPTVAECPPLARNRRVKYRQRINR
jgi:hypothetical protein